jgi:aquaporin Z
MAKDQAKYEKAMKVGLAYNKVKRWKDAFTAFRIAIGEFPHDAAAYAGLGEACLGLKQLDRALDCFKLAARYSKGDMRYLRSVADIQERQGQLAEAARTYLAIGEILLKQRQLEEAIGSCGSAVLAAAFPELGIGLLGVSLAFGLTVLTMAFAIGHISGCHLNPAVSIGLWVGGRFPVGQLVPYIVSQVLGGIVAGGVLYLIASGKAGFDVSAGFASNGYGEHSPGGYSLQAALITEVVMTMMFLVIILGATDKRAPQGFAPIAIGLALTLIHLISIPVTNTSVNPARSTGVAVFVGDWAVSQLWLFWVAPILGWMLGAVVYRIIGGSGDRA